MRGSENTRRDEKSMATADAAGQHQQLEFGDDDDDR